MVFARYSGFLHYLQRASASHELTTIDINVTKNKISNSNLVCHFIMSEKVTIKQFPLTIDFPFFSAESIAKVESQAAYPAT